MRIKMTTASCFILLALTLLPASADPISGNVYGVYPEGVMVNYGGGSYLVPTQHATFQVGGIRASWSNLQPGQAVNVQLPNLYWDDLVRVPDPYRWKLKHHPRHPHGGPPGQLKKRGPKQNGKHKRKGKRRKNR